MHRRRQPTTSITAAAAPPHTTSPLLTPPQPPQQQQRWRFQPLPPPWRAVDGRMATTAVWSIGHGLCRIVAVHRQTTIVVAVGRWYNHHSRTLWCRAVMAQPLVKNRGGQPPKTTTVVAAEPTLTTTAAPWWCRACGGLTEEERDFKQTKEGYLPKVIPFFKTLKDHFEGIQKALTKEIYKMKEIFKELEGEVDQNVVHKKHNEIERKNLLIANDNLIVDCLSKDVFYTAIDSVAYCWNPL
nr:integrase, catalytic region, zinc finger, CCHC-type, peptidase aspartic, catalytic [Tanacetum cinerariifolium]